MSVLNIGMIGAGFIGQLAHLMNFIEDPRCKILALAEYKPELRHKVARRFDIPKTYETHSDLLNDSEIDAVIVVTPRPFTGPIVFDCLKSGKHVLSEKPMVGCSEEGKILIGTAAEKNVKYAVGYMKRYDKGVEIAKQVLNEVLLSESLGPILSVHATCYMGNSYCNAYGHIVTDEKVQYWFDQWSIAPNWLPEIYHHRFASYLNTYSHVTNLLRYLFDITPAVEFVNLTDYGGQLVVLGFNQFLATLETGRMSYRGWSEEIKITFADGEIHIYLPPALLRNVPAKVVIYRAGKIQEESHPHLDWSWAFRRQAEAFVTDIVEDRQSRISAEDAFQEVLLIEEMWRQEMARLGLNHRLEKSA